MNTASQDYDKHLTILQEHMEHPTDYEKAVTYFLEEFAGDAKFVGESADAKIPQLNAVIAKVAGDAQGALPNQPPRLFHLESHHFYHGNAQVGNSIVIICYLEKADVGVLAMMPGANGENQIGRFKLGTALIKPENN